MPFIFREEESAIVLSTALLANLEREACVLLAKDGIDLQSVDYELFVLCGDLRLEFRIYKKVNEDFDRKAWDASFSLSDCFDRSKVVRLPLGFACLGWSICLCFENEVEAQKNKVMDLVLHRMELLLQSIEDTNPSPLGGEW